MDYGPQTEKSNKTKMTQDIINLDELEQPESEELYERLSIIIDKS